MFFKASFLNPFIKKRNEIISNFAPIKKGGNILNTDDITNECVVYFDKNVDRVNTIIQKSLGSGSSPEGYSDFVNNVDGFNVSYSPETFSSYFGSNNFKSEPLVQKAIDVQYKEKDRNEKDVPKSKKRSAGKQHKVAPIALPMDVSISQKALILALLRRSRS